MEAFIWMFRQKDFKKHFFYLVSITIYLIAFCAVVLTLFIHNNDKKLDIIIALITLLPSYFVMGYFWELTENIINRNSNILANNIYDNKIKKEDIIELPELNFLKFIWRGIVSFVASIIMVLPPLLLIYYIATSGSLCHVNPVALTIGQCLYYLFIPALLWNYAKQNSIVAPLNIFKAIYILGNYTFRYLKNVAIFFLVNSISIYVNNFIIQNFIVQNKQDNFLFILSAILFIIIFALQCYYFVFVYAYLLGTILPEEEA